MRQQGMSYRQIKAELGVSKGSLSLWLKGMPLSEKRLDELGVNNEGRIERYRETRAKKRNTRLQGVYEKVNKDIGTFSERELFLCGLFLYWGEGGKTENYAVLMANTDPSVLIFFKNWMNLLGVPKEKLKVRLQLYSDMDPLAEVEYWSKILDMPAENFRKPYIKSSNRLGLTYKQNFIHGTCNLLYGNRDIAEYVHTALEVIRNRFVAAQPQM